MYLDTHFWAISGPRGTRKTTARKKLERLLPERFPGYTFAFLGNPFTELPFPLLLKERDRVAHATTRLLWCWTRLNQFSIDHLRPALDAGHVVLTDGFGLDALLFAASCVDCTVESLEAEKFHHQIVMARIKAQNIVPPEYFITQADVETVDAWMVEYQPELEQLDATARRAFIVRQQETIRRYFLPEYGQRTPHYLDASISVDDMVEGMVEVIGSRLLLKRAS